MGPRLCQQLLWRQPTLPQGLQQQLLLLWNLLRLLLVLLLLMMMTRHRDRRQMQTRPRRHHGWGERKRARTHFDHLPALPHAFPVQRAYLPARKKPWLYRPILPAPRLLPPAAGPQPGLGPSKDAMRKGCQHAKRHPTNGHRGTRCG